MRLRTRYSIKFLLLLTAVVALILAVIKFRPSPEIRVTFRSDDIVTVNDQPIDTEMLRCTIDRERSWRKMWIQSSSVVIVLPETVLFNKNLFTCGISLRSNDKLTIQMPKVDELLKKHKLSGLENIVIGGVNTESMGLIDVH